jgi:hypothetical protein
MAPRCWSRGQGPGAAARWLWRRQHEPDLGPIRAQSGPLVWQGGAGATGRRWCSGAARHCAAGGGRMLEGPIWA